MRLFVRQLATLLAILLAGSSVAPGYYYFTRYNSRFAPWIPIVDKFDLNALSNRTVPYFIADAAPVQFASNDTMAALNSQIRAAAKVWSDVETSELRLAFGGMTQSGTVHNSPAIEVTFEELPPGVVATGGPTVRADFNGSFVPMLRSSLKIAPDMRDRPSYSEAVFGTLVHEFGHTIGLQHTLTSSVMSITRTRSTSKGKPLAADDIAGISLLYPKPGYVASTGSITGRVVLNGQGVNLASVVALAPNGPAISALTNPDGSYRIDGLPPREYYVYVHPLPPALQGQFTPADIILPVNLDRTPLQPGGPFETQFYPGTRDPSQAFTVQVGASVTAESINFAVRSRGQLQLHTVEMFAFPGNVAVRPPYLNPARPLLVATGSGLVAAASSGLAVSVVRGSALPVRPYVSAPQSYVQLDVDPRSFAFLGESARHLLLTWNNDIYVLPSAFYQVDRQPPFIGSVATGADANGARIVAVTGANLTADTRILFDGIAATVRSVDEGSGRMVVTPPAAVSGYRAVLVAVNPDGQSSLAVQPDNPPSYTYESEGLTTTGAASVSSNGASLSPGIEAMIEINGFNTNFVDGQTTVGFGTADVTARRLWVVGPNRLLVNVSVSPSAQSGLVMLSVISGLQVHTNPSGFQVQPPGSRALALSPQLLNASTGAPGVGAGSAAVATVSNAQVPASGAALTLNDRPIPILSAAGNQITFQVPPGTPAGPAILRLDTQTDRGLPVIVQIDSPAAQT